MGTSRDDRPGILFADKSYPQCVEHLLTSYTKRVTLRGKKGDGRMTGETIAALRLQRGLTQKQLAARLGVSPSTVGMYEQGRRQPGPDMLRKLAAALGTDVNRLLAPPPTAVETEVSPLDEEMMQAALELAREAAAEGEVPVGCVVALGERIVGRGRNRREGLKNVLAHAELEAMDAACRTLGGWRLWQCTLYVTLEPCPMCAGAIVNARIPRVVYGASDPKAGACGSVCDLFCMAFNHHPRAQRGLLEEACVGELKTFFRDLRQRRKKR